MANKVDMSELPYQNTKKKLGSPCKQAVLARKYQIRMEAHQINYQTLPKRAQEYLHKEKQVAAK